MPPREAPLRRVSVPVPLLAGLVAAVLACLLAIAWLLGRESGRRLARDPGPAATSLAPTPAPTATPARLLPAPLPTAPPVPAPVPSPGFREPPPATPASAVEPPGPESGEAAAVARYFSELESLSSARYWDDPQALAMSIVQELAGGGTGGVERLRRVQAEVEGAVRRMSVPEPCREHHRRSLELSAAAGRLLQSISQGAASGDLSGVMSATAEAERLQRGAEELRELENDLRRRYGLPAAPS